ncbi:MAG: hemerythrin domain-containing protein [Rhodopila sp.]|jgi:hypothetical protein
MNLRTFMQTGPAKANELFARLAETSDGAIKTREKLFADLKAELELHISLEEQHLFPVLRRNAETKGLVTDAIKDNKELRAKLGELESLPKNDEAFPERLKDLQKLFRQHARDEKRELLPAVQQALTEEQVQNVTERIEAGLAEAEQARQDEQEERRAKARQEREEATRRAEQQAEAERARDAAAEQARQHEAEQARAKSRQEREEAEQTRAKPRQEHEEADHQPRQQAAAAPLRHEAGRQVDEAAARAARTAQANTLRVVETAAAGAQRVQTEMRDATASYVRAVRTMVPDAQDLISLPRAAAGAMTDFRSAWLDWMNQTTRVGTQVSQELLRQTAEQQRRFAADAMQCWVDHNTRVMQITMRMAQEGLRPFFNRSADGSDERRAGR